MSQIFDKIRVGTSKRSTFDLSHSQITTSDFGYLIPICYRDMVPNDDFVVTPQVFCRLAPLQVPVYGRIVCRLHHFFVPYRILYKHWDAFITQSNSNFTAPPSFTVSILRQALGTDPAFSSQSGLTLPRGIYSRLMSNFGINPELILSPVLDGSEKISAFPFLAYYRIWADYFMDSNIKKHEDVINTFNNLVQDGGSLVAGATSYLQYRSCCFKKDYFTTAKLNPQDGVASVVGADIADENLNPGLHRLNSFTSVVSDGSNISQNNSTAQSQATSKIAQFTVEAVRAANAVQRYLERNNFVGSKLINRLLVHFGATPSAERLDMSEFIGGESFPIDIQDVTSHTPFSVAETDPSNYSTAGLGFQGGKGVGYNRSNSVRYHASEHGCFMTLMSILPDTSYYQGLPRMFQKGVNGEPLDFFTPEFENLGYQELLNKEVYIPNSVEAANYQSYDPNGVFGYTPRFSEYKFHQDILAGDLLGRNHSTSEVIGAIADSWHLFRKLRYSETSPLALNENFVECKNNSNDYDRVFQYTSHSYDHFYFNIRCDVKATRPMSGFVEPTLDVNNDFDGDAMNMPYGGTRL